jgi:3-isopropylmalate/(R)-2-methylmalate dehydratase small subunit
LGDKVFHDLRFHDDGSEKSDFALNKPEAVGCSILVAGRNFGCGSSREHAPWGLLDYGFEAVISSELADIFRNNSLKNGLVAIVVDEAAHSWLLKHPGADLVIDVEHTTITLPDARVLTFDLDGFARSCLVEGIDQLGFLQRHLKNIESFEEARPWKP